MSIRTCPACGGDDIEPLVDLGEVPALCGAMWSDAAGARDAARGHLDLVVCPECAHVWNAAFDERLIDYDADYDNSLHHSSTFQRFADELAGRLAATHDLRGGYVLEIGSGKGEFLSQLCSLADCEGVGFDPTFTGTSTTPGVELVAEYFPVGSAPERPFDLLLCRHVLEHLADPVALLTGLVASARATGTRPTFYFEVPSAAFNFGPAGLWDCIYPHVSYFSMPSLRRLIERAGLTVVRIEQTFHGQFLSVEAVAADIPGVSRIEGDDVAAHLTLLGSFADRLQSTVQEWSARITGQEQSGDQVALWGAGAKAVVFLNAVDGAGRLRAVVDVNPGKWGRFLPGTGHQVLAPAALPTDVSAVLVTNAAYLDEITEQLAGLGVHADVLAV